MAKDKLDGKIAELADLRKKLEEANAKIQSFAEMDIEGIKANAASWEKKYKEDMKALEEKMADREYGYQIDALLSKVPFTSEAARRATRADLMQADNRLSTKDGKVIGFDDYIALLKESDPTAVKADEPEEPPKKEKKPEFLKQKSQGQNKKTPTLSELMQMANDGKDVSSWI